MLTRFVLPFFLLLSLFVLAACSPEFNWRELPVANGMVKATFPNKPDTLEQTLEFAGQEIRFTVSAARAGGTLFAVAYASLPDGLAADTHLRTQMGQTVLRSFYENLQLPVPDPLPDFGDLLVLEGIPASGESKGQATVLQARVWMYPQALVEGMVVGRAGRFPEGEADEFLRSIKAGVR